MDYDSRELSDFSEMERLLRRSQAEENEPLIQYIANHGKDFQWSHEASTYLIRSCPETPSLEMRARLECLAMIAPWVAERSDEHIVEFATESLIRLSRWMLEDHGHAENENAYVSVVYCLNILANLPTDKAMKVLSETAAENDGDEFGRITQQLLVLATQIRVKHPSRYTRVTPR
jgi:hypothetical protein